MSNTFILCRQRPLTILDVVTLLGEHKWQMVGTWKTPNLDETRYPSMTVMTVEMRTKEDVDNVLADGSVHERAVGCSFFLDLRSALASA